MLINDHHGRQVPRRAIREFSAAERQLAHAVADLFASQSSSGEKTFILFRRYALLDRILA
jgi:hypothetical protein